MKFYLKHWSDLISSMRWLVSLGILMFSLLSGCAVQQTHQTLSIDIQNWLDKNINSSKLKTWKFDGRFGAKTSTENWSGSIVWQQNNDQYAINIAGPLNMGSAILKGNANHAEFVLSDRQSFYGDNAQALLFQHTGLILPVEKLQYWLHGLPAPDDDIRLVELNNNGTPRKFSQNNWEIKFKRYQLVNDHLLPNKIFLTHQNINVRLIIQNWQISHE